MRLLPFAIILLAASLLAAEGNSPPLASYSLVQVNQIGSVSVIGGGMQSISLNLSMPISASYQKVDYSGKSQNDSEGNSYIKIEQKNPENPFSYSKQFIVQATSRSTLSLPSAYAVPVSYSKYLQNSQQTQSSNPLIKQAALDATENASDQFEKVAALAIYVNSRMAYDESLTGKKKDALWAFQNRRGVCAEYSTLFAALSRSIGIPARYVTGYVYSDRFNSWIGHAWNEAYIGEWVPVDATWFEVGRADALHIEEAKFAEITDRNRVSASVDSPGAQIVWDTPGQEGALAKNIVANSISYDQPRSDFSLFAAARSIPLGGKTLALLTIEGKDYSAIPVSLATCTGEEIITVESPDQYAILRPGKNTTIAWELSAGRSLSSGYVYSCPLTLNSPYLETRTLAMKVDPSIKGSTEFGASLSSATTAPGKENSVLLSIPNTLIGKRFFVSTGGSLFSGKITSQNGELPFTVSGIGQQPVFVASEAGGFARLSQTVTREPQDITVESLTVDSGAMEGRKSTARAGISSSSYPAELDLTFTACGKPASTSALISSPSAIELEFIPEKSGGCLLTLVASKQGSSETFEKSTAITILADPALAEANKPLFAPSEGGESTQAAGCAMPLAILSLSLAFLFIRR